MPLVYVVPIVAAAIIFSLLLVCGLRKCRSAANNREEIEPYTDEESGTQLAYKSTNMDDTTNTNTEQLHQAAGKTKSGRFLSEAEKWERAKFIFPGIVHTDSSYSRTNPG